MDSFDGNNKVDRDEFVIGLKEIGLNLSKGESDVCIYTYYIYIYSFKAPISLS